MIVRASSPSYPWFCSIFTSESTVACQARVRHVPSTEHHRIVYIRETELFPRCRILSLSVIHVSYSEGGRVTPSWQVYFHILVLPNSNGMEKSVLLQRWCPTPECPCWTSYTNHHAYYGVDLSGSCLPLSDRKRLGWSLSLVLYSKIFGLGL